MRVLLLRW
jgi:hypothetical protein